MAGQIIKRGTGKWLVRIEKRSADGSRKSVSKTIVGTRRDAQKVLNEMLHQNDRGMLSFSKLQSLNEYLDFWLSTIAKLRVRSRTFADYTDLMRRYVRPAIGNVRVGDITPAHIQNMYNEMSLRGLSPRVVRYTHAVLSSALRKATELDLVPRNVAKMVQLPRQTKKEMHAMSREQAVVFNKCLEEERFGPMLSVALSTGMRVQEYLGLRWSDLSMDMGTATIQRALVWNRKGGGWYFDQPKTSKSRRTIPLSASTVDSLRRHRRLQLQQRILAGSAWNDLDLVFASEIGTPLNPANVTRVFKKILIKAGLPTTFRLYDLRHTTATLLLEAGVNPKVVSERLGHASITLTLDVYSHVLPHMQADATARLEALLSVQRH
jgi:integrase